MALPRWMYGDPAKVYERMEAGRQKQVRQDLKEDPFGALWKKGEMVMTREESDQVEELLMVWYERAKPYKVALGAPRISPYCRGMDSSDVYADADDVDARINAADAEAVEACLNELSWQARSAVGMHLATKAGDAKVWRNPRLTPEEAHAAYQQAKVDLLPQFHRKGLLRRAL